MANYELSITRINLVICKHVLSLDIYTSCRVVPLPLFHTLSHLRCNKAAWYYLMECRSIAGNKEPPCLPDDDGVRWRSEFRATRILWAQHVPPHAALRTMVDIVG